MITNTRNPDSDLCAARITRGAGLPKAPKVTRLKLALLGIFLRKSLPGRRAVRIANYAGSVAQVVRAHA